MSLDQTCPSCGGVIGRDCWNPQECAEITRQMGEQPSRVAELEAALSAITAERDGLREALREIVKARPGWRSAAETALAALHGGER